MSKKILFLDYDGVLFDTLKEIYVVNRYLYLNVSFFDEIKERNYALYSKYKYLAYNIWMFYYYNPLIFNEENNIEEKFNSAILKRNLYKEEKYCDIFIKTRTELIRQHYDFWKNLETPFEFFENIKKLYNEKKIDIAIVSKKNKASILDRFRVNNFNLDEENIFGREILDGYYSKADFIDKYMKENGYSEAIFVDDNHNNLLTCKKYENIKTMLALWGNTGNKHQGFNQKEAYEIIYGFFN